ncbi:TlpA family protein disulfide reductase, partial [bacterium]
LISLFALASSLKAQMYSDFTLPDINGEDVSHSKIIANGPVLIGFWASWCTPCKEEMKKINDLYIKYKDKGFTYLALNVDNQKSVAKVKSYVDAQNFAFTVLMDTDKRVFEAYSGKDEMPYSIMLNKNKEVVSVHTGFKTGDEVKIEEEIITILGLK